MWATHRVRGSQQVDVTPGTRAGEEEAPAVRRCADARAPLRTEEAGEQGSVHGTTPFCPGAPLCFLLHLSVALLGLVGFLRHLQEALRGGDVSSVQRSVVVVLPHLVELVLRFLPLGFSLLKRPQGVLSVWVFWLMSAPKRGLRSALLLQCHLLSEVTADSRDNSCRPSFCRSLLSLRSL
jgi:hypothetical protein